MSRLALDWVKKNFSFSRRVDSIEKDFSDGVLFASILRQRGLLNEFDIANESGTPSAAAENLKLLRNKLRSYEIDVNKSIIADVSLCYFACLEYGFANYDSSIDYVRATRRSCGCDNENEGGF
jgi:hypothetical protein